MKVLRFLLVFFLCVCIALVTSLLLSRYGLSVSYYTFNVPQYTKPIRIVQLTDLHNSEFGAHNRRLIRKVAVQEPDLILITGDLLNLNEERTDIAADLISQLSQLAPVYVSYGNHEAIHEQKYGSDLRSLYTDAGATVLEYEWTEISVKDQSIRLGGIYGYCLPAKYRDNGPERAAECDFVEAFQDTDDYTILMCHMPYSWIKHDSLNSWDVDLVLCGHVHGGQVRIPFVGGLWAPDQGWFPGRECGVYWSEDCSSAMVLSRGLGNTDRLPRFNNIPEVLVLDLQPAQIISD